MWASLAPPRGCIVVQGLSQIDDPVQLMLFVLSIYHRAARRCAERSVYCDFLRSPSIIRLTNDLKVIQCSAVMPNLLFSRRRNLLKTENRTDKGSKPRIL